MIPHTKLLDQSLLNTDERQFQAGTELEGKEIKTLRWFQITTEA